MEHKVTQYKTGKAEIIHSIRKLNNIKRNYTSNGTNCKPTITHMHSKPITHNNVNPDSLEHYEPIQPKRNLTLLFMEFIEKNKVTFNMT